MANYSPGNPFVQKKYSPGNPFAREPAELPAEPEMMENSHTPTPEPQSMEEMLAAPMTKRQVQGIGMGVMDPVYGAAQLVTKGVEKATGQESPYFKESLIQREKDYGQQEGFDIPRVIGTAINPATWLGPKKVQVAGRVLKGGVEALGKYAGINALQSMAMPVAPDEDYWKTQEGRAAFGAMIGTALGGAGSAAINAQKLLKSRISDAPGQATRYLKDMFGADAPEVARQLDALSSKVPGEKPTVGWLSTLEEGRWPQMAAIEKQARGSDVTAGAFNIRDKANTDAQLALMDTFTEPGKRPLGVEGTKFGKELESPIELKATSLAKPYYDDATQQMMYVPEKLKRAMQGKEAIQALRKGEDIVSQAQLNAEAGLSSRRPSPPAIKGGEVNAPTEQNIDVWNQDQWRNRLPMESVGSLQTQRQSMDSLLRASRTATNPADIEAARLLREVRGGLTDRMRKASPEFDMAEEIFRQEMAPQNRADYVGALRNKFDSPEGPNQISFLNALRNPEKTASGAGIPFKVDSTEQLMGQGAAGARRMSQIDALRGSAERDLALRAVYAPGKIKGKFDDLGEELNQTLPPFLSAKVTAIKRLGDLYGNKLTKGMRKVIDEAALEPSKMAELLRAANPEDRNAIMNGLRAMQQGGVRPVTGVLRSEMSREYGGPN